MATGPTFLTARWRQLAILNFHVDPGLLAPYVPRGTRLDFFAGQTYLSIVGFQFLGTKIFGLPALGHRNFAEVNLRFYVKREMASECRRGVVFIKEIAPSRVLAAIARAFYNENYLTVPTASRVDLVDGEPPPGGSVRYDWRFAGRRNYLSLDAAGPARLPAADSLESFIVEHYWGYSAQRDGGCLEYLVEHPPWHVYPVSNIEWDCDAAALYGPELGPFLATGPCSACLADGSAVVVRRGRRI